MKQVVLIAHTNPDGTGAASAERVGDRREVIRDFEKQHPDRVVIASGIRGKEDEGRRH